MTTLELKAQHDALQKIATTRDPVKAIAEFVWNALDADATKVSVTLERNALGGIEAIVIRDNGTGITRDRALADFEMLGASWKRSRQRTRLNRLPAR
jgi:signal transduction histidine kinase